LIDKYQLKQNNTSVGGEVASLVKNSTIAQLKTSPYKEGRNTVMVW